jgi:hypothetical protein
MAPDPIVGRPGFARLPAGSFRRLPPVLDRFALALMLAVVAAASRPRAAGGTHDLLAVGVVVEETREGRTERRFVLGMPEGAAKEAYETFLRGPAARALVQGSPVAVPARPASGNVKVVEVLFYGRASRAGRASIAFAAAGATELDGADALHDAAAALAALPPTVTGAAARVLLRSEDTAAYADALEVLASVHAGSAAAEAMRTASDEAAAPARRTVALKVLQGLGGRKAFGEPFERAAISVDAALRKPLE